MPNKAESEQTECRDQNKPEWLTSQVFEEFLERDLPNAKRIKKFTLSPAVTTGENFMTVLLRAGFEIEMQNEAMEQMSYMIKVMPKEEGLRSLVAGWQLFTKERTTYMKYIPKFEEYFKAAGEKVHFAPQVQEVKNVKIPEDYLILEDLSRKGYKNAKRQLGLDMEHTEAVLRKLAQFHAVSARYALIEEEYPPLYDQCLPCEKDEFADYRLRTGETFREHLPNYGDVMHLEHKLKKIVETQTDPFQKKSLRNPEEFNVLNHGDLWVNNIMFQYNEDGSLRETLFIDFQMGRYGSPAQDLLYFLLSSTSLEIKVKHFDYFISYYHAQLERNLRLIKYEGNIPTLRDIHIALYRHDYWVYAITVVLLPIVVCDPRDDANAHTSLDEDGEKFRKFTFSNSRIAEHMRILLPWLNNRGAFES